MRSVLWLTVAAGCSDYGLQNQGDPEAPPPDLSCQVDLPEGDKVHSLDECQPYNPDTVDDPWDVQLEWTFPAAKYIVATPVTGELTDDNDDHVVDSRDMPDVAFTSYMDGRLYIVSGDGSGEICHQDGWQGDGGIIIADVDSDGNNEVVGPLADGHIRAVDGICRTKWTSQQSYAGQLLYAVTTAADLDEDGRVEVIADVAVVDGQTGAPIATLTPKAGVWRAPVVGDIDQDGDQEIVLGDSVFDKKGRKLFSAGGSGTSSFGALAQLDNDPEAEVIFSYGANLGVYERDGTPKWHRATRVTNPGPPCVGDIDGDGESEVIAPSGTALMAFEADGTPKWSAPMQDGSGAAGCIVYDMNADGVYEILFADEIALRVYDGKTGQALYENLKHDSGTYFETPVVADVDNDGSAEMLVVNSPVTGGASGLTVFGHVGSEWPASGQTWGLHDFSATNQNPDGSIPQHPDAPWLKYGIFRGRPYDDYPGTPNLTAEVVDVCTTGCDGSFDADVVVSFQVSNDGGSDVDATKVSLYLVDQGEDVFFDSQRVPALDQGRSSDALTFTIPFDQWTGKIALVVDDEDGDAQIDECHEDDNRTVYSADLCG
jgi:hypothetical protein